MKWGVSRCRIQLIRHGFARLRGHRTTDGERERIVYEGADTSEGSLRLWKIRLNCIYGPASFNEKACIVQRT